MPHAYVSGVILPVDGGWLGAMIAFDPVLPVIVHRSAERAEPLGELWSRPASDKPK